VLQVKKLDRLQREDAERIADLAGFDHGEGLDQRQPLHPQFFAWFGSRRALREIPCQKSDELLVGDRIGELALYHFLPSRGAQAGFLGKLARAAAACGSVPTSPPPSGISQL